jgi:glycosyltransferase involved in cell wall biosynthesis
MREDFGQAGYAVENWAVVVNGVDLEKFRPATQEDRTMIRQKLGFGEEEVILGLVGRYGLYKGHLRLLRAFEQVAAKRPELKLVLVGDGGPMRAAVTEAVEASPVKGQVVQAGYQAEMRPYYQALDLLVVASENEGLSNAVLEAMSCGVPVLASAACGNAEVLQDGLEGMVKDLGSEEALQGALEEALRDAGALEEMGRKARARAERDFGISSMAAGYEELYRSLGPGGMVQEGSGAQPAQWAKT